MNCKIPEIIKELKKSSGEKEFFEELKKVFNKQFNGLLLEVFQLDILPPFYLPLFSSQNNETILKEFFECKEIDRKENFVIIGQNYIYPISIDNTYKKYLLVFSDQINRNFYEIKKLCDSFNDIFELLTKNYQYGHAKSSLKNANLISQMSHDINSMISLIKSNIPELETVVSDKMNYTEKMTKDILQYVREIEILESSVDVVELMDSIINNIKIPDTIKISKNYNIENENIRVDVELINRAVSEILHNSLAAIDMGSGKITIEAQAEEFKNPFIKNKYLVIRIKDKGKGINPDFLELVKNPFFTTQKSEYHSGLGLSIANKIIEAHGGVLKIENSNESKTIVSVYLPMLGIENE